MMMMMMMMSTTTGAVLASKAEAIVDRGQIWPQATKQRTGD